MIDFAGVTAVQIPEGNCVKITRKSDSAVIWEKPVSGELPNGYTQLKYIKFTGDQAVETEVIPDYKSKIECVFVREINESRYLYGVLSANHAASVTAYITSTSGNWRFCGTTKTLAVSLNVKHTSVQSAEGVLFNGKLTAYTGVSAVAAPASLVLGSARNANGGLEDTFFVGKVYEFRMYDGETLTAEYIPAQNPDGVYGFWDTVSRTFKTSITGTALSGA